MHTGKTDRDSKLDKKALTGKDRGNKKPDTFKDNPDRRKFTKEDIPHSIPQHRIADEAIAYVAKKFGIQESLVTKVHDFQWAEIKSAADNIELIHVSKFFKLRLGGRKVERFIQHLQKELDEYDKEYDTAIKNRQKRIDDRRKEIHQQIKYVSKQLANCKQPYKR